MKSPSDGDGSHAGVAGGFQIHCGVADNDAVLRAQVEAVGNLKRSRRDRACEGFRRAVLTRRKSEWPGNIRVTMVSVYGCGLLESTASG